MLDLKFDDFCRLSFLSLSGLFSFSRLKDKKSLPPLELKPVWLKKISFLNLKALF